MSENFLLLNSDKTEMLVIAPAETETPCWSGDHIYWQPCYFSSSNVKNLGVSFDSTLSFDQHITEMSKIAFYHNIAKN